MRGRFGVDDAFPLRDQRPQLLRNVLPHAREVVALGEIGTEIEQVRMHAVDDQFPVAAPHGSSFAGTRAGAPEKSARKLRRATLPHGKKVHAFELRLGRNGRAGHGQNRGREIHRDADLIRHEAGRDHVRPAHHRRHANAAFVQVAFDAP